MKAADLKRIIDQFNRETLAKPLGAEGSLGPEILPPGTASVTRPLEAADTNRCDCFCGKTPKGYKSARNFVDTCLTLTDPNAAASQVAVGSVAVGAVMDDTTGSSDDDLPVVLAVGINYGQGKGYLNSPVPTVDRTGMRSKLQKPAQLLASQNCEARGLDEPFHLVAANFFPWITSEPWSSYNFNSIEEAALVSCCGYSDPHQYILDLIALIKPAAVVFHGANNAVPYMGAEVVRRSLAANHSSGFEVVFSDNLAGSYQPGVWNAIWLCYLDANRAAMAVRDFDE
ncbi:hypothetical protein OJ996_05430 [Luteolibacter sp. GHJ8]|uniref:Uncharacterized protein n=1 Tax=Luteolibacter rhizosphaerae TaxID=2989719 RepID=A0ABT3FZJ8_9BACT|nr:hypothetical protein [Luteolibacter rhizosphaerae]MCW1913001.1 hypothetical protein [Luteolibacter rhizosphaerae]